MTRRVLRTLATLSGIALLPAVAAVSLAQDPTPAPGKRTETYGAEVYRGTCTNPAARIANLDDAAVATGSYVGSVRALPVALSITREVPLLADGEGQSRVAIRIVARDGGDRTPLACGDLDAEELVGEQAIGLGAADDSGVSGIAYLAPNAGDESLADVWVFVTEQTPERPAESTETLSPQLDASTPDAATPPMATAEFAKSPVPAATPGVLPAATPAAPVGASYADAVRRTAGLVAYWRLDEIDRTTATDSSGNGFDGQYMRGAIPGGPSAVAGEDDASTLFAGTADAYVDMGDIFDFAGSAPFTIEAWIQPVANGADYYSRIVQKEAEDVNGQRNGYVLWRQTADGRVGFDRWLEDQVVTISTREPIPNDEWAHVVATFDGRSVKLFVNGDLADTSQATQPLPDTRDAFLIGARSSGGSNFNGFIDDVAIYDVALDDETVIAHYRAATRTDGLQDSQGGTPASE